MASPILILIKPLMKSITKAAIKTLGKATVKSTLKGLNSLAKGSFSPIDAINIARSTIDKKNVSSIAKSLGLTTNELNQITSELNMTDIRKKAVTGKNYIHNLNRFLEKPQSSVKSYINNNLKKSLNSVTNQVQTHINDEFDKLLETPKLIALRMLEGKLKQAEPLFSFSKKIWDNINNIDEDIILEILEEIESDLYYNTINDEVIMTNEEHKGYQQGILFKDYTKDIEYRLLGEVIGQEINGII